MTSPENAEPPTVAEDKATPPWQRLSKESGNGTADGPTQWLPTGRTGENVLHSESAAGDQTVVSGSAAGSLFGPPGEAREDALAGLRGQETVSVPGPGTKGRGTPSALRRPGRGPRRASLQVKRFDPWSVLKLSLVLGVAMFFVWLVAVGVLYTVLDGMGVWDKLNGTYSSLVSGEGGSAPSDPLISAGRVFGIAAILGAINIVLLSALATVSAFIYNVSADLAGGLEVTLSERE
ncbi:DUF3566 domain-containing protein [Amycolatopsis acidiphila]|uniref:DUF3566 domain-containing protein n=1 Tax=Amycolatopsis acidiphila TaxID=715473 RepID=A0A558AFX5_9PSEU|nr:DUF3566 domain-containing protein [Amycolatopsis acidiphila]TVT23168.1 DUF3566 domain-containing protein [Amycolatopsis acidiphila]UIJ60139.1 DUF3566 domain-containing protein [Amycolatopsis acidiphila]GHG61140.1 hypothetical protein GCM10017788_15530 [Amycolatopsis acidiphila]